MLNFGISTATLYPLDTEESLRIIAELGAKHTEIFFNAMSELRPPVFDRIIELKNEYGIAIDAFHPFQSAFESLYLFSAYERRVDEMIEMYKRYFEAMNTLGTKIFVLHGAFSHVTCPTERYIERLDRLLTAAESMDVIIAQENVSYCKSGSVNFLSELKAAFGERLAYVVDMKQAIRAGVSVYDVLEVTAGQTIHIHASDSNGERDCMPVGEGEFDFAQFFRHLERLGVSGSVLLELYRQDYSSYSELFTSVERMNKIYNHVDVPRL